MEKDRARKKTDRMLNLAERRINDVYANDPSLLRISKKFNDYMKKVSMQTKKEYNAYKREKDADKKEELKKVYTDKVRQLTLGNEKYRMIIKELTRVMSSVNQKAIDVVNDDMDDVYMVNYNQMAVDCKEIGVKVDGKQ